MTITHRLTFTRDGPKVITVTDTQKLPYKLEVGMFASSEGYESEVIAFIDDEEPSIKLADSRWVPSDECIADIDHPGTRGLLLQQYRDASGHARACVTFYTDSDGDDDDALPCFTGPWGVDSAEDPDRNIIVGEGESEGAAILDALKRLAASKAAANDAGDGPTIDPVKLADRLARIEQRLDAFDANRIARIEQQLAHLRMRVTNRDDYGAP